MIVPNYIPEPIEVPGNVTEERYPVRLAFIRRVTLLHLLSVVVLGGLFYLPWPAVGWGLPLVVLAVLLLASDFARIARRGLSKEATISTALLLPILLATAWWLRELDRSGVPVWAPLAGVAGVFLYTLLCRQDYSFLGCWLLALIGSNVAIAALIDVQTRGSTYALWALGLNAVYLTYLVYDLASLMARRRRGEEPAAVTDLYRDVFNLFGYVVRVVGHWRKHRIWVAKG